MRSINLGVVVSQSIKLTVLLPLADPDASVMISAGDDRPFARIPAVAGGEGRQFEVGLDAGHYVLVVDSKIRPGTAGLFTVGATSNITFWSATHPDPKTTPRPWQLSMGTTATVRDPKDPWPEPSVQVLDGAAATAAMTGSRIRATMSSLLDANAGRGADPSKPPGKVRALLIGIDRYAPGTGAGTAHYGDLRGCVTDIRETEGLLRAKLGDVEVTRMLSPLLDEAEQLRATDLVPTYDNIVAAWQAIIEASASGDLVYIHYSGHGGRVKTLFSDIKPAGVDEALVPCDINDPSTGRYLRDVEMALLLQRLAARDVNITVVLDSCHAGSFTRGDQARPRTRADGLPDLEPRGSDALGSAVGTPEELTATAQALAHDVTDATWKLAPDGRLHSVLTVIAACAATEGAYEYNPDGGATCGALTYYWLRALRQLRPGTTYRQAFAQVFSGVHSAFANQSPMLLGEADRELLGTEVLARVPALHVSELHGDVVTIDGGSSLQIDPGTTLAIIPTEQLPELVELAGLPAVEVFDNTATTASARRVAASHDATIELGASAVVRSYPLQIQRGVRIAAPSPFDTTLAAAIAAEPSQLLAVSTTSAAFQVIVGPDLVAEIADAQGQALPHVARTPIGIDGAAATIVRQLVHLARYSNMQAFTNQDPHASLANLFHAELATLEQQDTPVTGVLRIADGEGFCLRLTNQSASTLTYYLLNLRPDWSIALLKPDGDVIEPRGEVTKKKLHGSIDDPLDVRSRDIIAVLATLAPVDASLLTLAALGAPALPRDERGPDDPPLQELMRILQDPLAGQRKATLDETPSTGWLVAQVEFETTRPPPTGADRASSDELLANAAVRAALGGTLIGEELRGDLVAARAAAGEGTLERILVDALSGNTGAARRALATLAAQPAEAAARTVQRRLALIADVRCFADGVGDGGASFDDIVGQWDQRIAPQPSDDRLPLTGAVTASELALMVTWIELGSARGVLATGARLPVPRQAALADLRADFAARLRAPDGLAPLCSPTWVALADASLLRCAGERDAALAVIREQRAACVANGDAQGAGLCWLAEGDLRACVIESPATLGLWLGGDSGFGIESAGAPEADALEHARVSSEELAAARQAFEAARASFAAAGARRAVATADLGLAGCAALAADPAEARRLANSAEAELAALGDERGGRLARIHGVLADVADLRTVDPAVVREIGAWGRGVGDLSYALGLGTLLTHAGRRWWFRDAGYEQALQCARLAEQLFRAAGAPLAAVQALGDQVAAHQGIHDRGAATDAALRADDLLAEVGPRPVLTLPVLARRILVLFRVWQLAADAQDAGGMERLAERIGARASELAAAAMAPDLRAALQSVIEDVRDTTASVAPRYRAGALELDPVAPDAAREAAWQLAETRLQAIDEPRRWYFEALLYGDRGDFARAAEAAARYGDADPTWGTPPIAPDAPAALVTQAQRARANQAFSLFVRFRDPARARVYLDELRALDGEAWWQASSTPWLALSSYGDLQLVDGDTAGAIESYRQASALLDQTGALLIDDSSKTAFADSVDAQHLFGHAAFAALSGNPADPARAFDFIERGRARALADLVSDVRVGIAGSDPIASWRAAVARRDTARALIGRALVAEAPDPTRIAELRRTLDDREREVTTTAAQAQAQAATRFAALDARTAVAPIARVVEQLAAGVLVIELAVLDGRLLGWAVTRAGIVPKVVGALDDRRLRRAALQLQHGCAKASRPVIAAEALANDLLMPFADEIRAATQVVFAVSGELARVPFHALPFDGDALIARVAVSYVPSASLIDRLAAVPVAGRPILVVGDPPNMAFLDPDGRAAPRALPALPGAHSEAVAIGALVAGSRVLIDDASAAAVAAALPTFRVVHFATHARVDTESPWRSAIALANGDQLSVADLMGLALSADLIVLSACSSGTGEATRGEEVLGLARGLLAAGARAVIVALWDVYDVPTRALMVELHRQLQLGQTPAEALRAAQRYVRQLDPLVAIAQLEAAPGTGAARRNATLDDEEASTPLPGYAHPAYWAPFVLVGV